MTPARLFATLSQTKGMFCFGEGSLPLAFPNGDHEMSKTGWSVWLFWILTTGFARSQSESFQASLTPDCAVHGRNTQIEGLTLSVWGENPQTAFSIGLVNGSTGESIGLSLGLMNYADSYSGAQWSLFNFTESNFTGWQGGPCFGLVGSILNYTGGTTSGLQTGVINLTGGLEGVQAGFINYAQRVDMGLQIGLINLIGNTEGWGENWPREIGPGMILANWRF